MGQTNPPKPNKKRQNLKRLPKRIVEAEIRAAVAQIRAQTDAPAGAVGVVIPNAKVMTNVSNKLAAEKAKRALKARTPQRSRAKISSRTPQVPAQKRTSKIPQMQRVLAARGGVVVAAEAEGGAIHRLAIRSRRIQQPNHPPLLTAHPLLSPLKSLSRLRRHNKIVTQVLATKVDNRKARLQTATAGPADHVRGVHGVLIQIANSQMSL